MPRTLWKGNIRVVAYAIPREWHLAVWESKNGLDPQYLNFNPKLYFLSCPMGVGITSQFLPL